jgi:eukaryotic-like serine/threonine-protein kinase
MIAPPSRRPPGAPPPPPVYYDLDEPIHRRPVWPWLAALFFVVVAALGGYLLYSQISNKLASNKPVGVGNYVGIVEQLARQKIVADGFVPKVTKHFSRKVQTGLVFLQRPDPGTRLGKGSPVYVFVSTGLPKVVIPSVVDSNVTDAVTRLTKLGLKVKQRSVGSLKAAGTITAQDPPSGTKVEVGTLVTVNVAKGPLPVSVPGVIGQPLATASSTLQALHFRVVTTFVEATDPANTVIQQSPGAGASAGTGSVVTLTVSKGPSTSTVPDVSSLDVGSATTTLAGSGFKWKIVYEDVADPTLDGTVLSQAPDANTEQKPGTVVTLTVGRTATQTTTTTGTTTTTP